MAGPALQTVPRQPGVATGRTMNRYVCIHGHFYQPPRENPWLEAVELQDSAYPYHDWNERITAECYAPNAASRLMDGGDRITAIVNNYSRISFNFGPTLLQWLERHSPEVHQALIDADRESQERFSGHGSALAQVYNHVIMPLANSRDKHTQVVWGKRDFMHRFSREPEGMWLAETAVDTATLEVLAEHGIKFTVLAPRQAGRIRRLGRHTKVWHDVRDARVNPRMPYLCVLPSGRTINLFFYDGPISQEIAFAGLLRSGETFAGRLMGAFTDDRHAAQLVHIATDGETYGHHHRYGDMALAYCLHYIEQNELAKLTVYGEFLEMFPPTYEVEIVENTSWSCAHGVERWKSNCGCNTGRDGWVQEWRSPLRSALDWLRDELAEVFEIEGAKLLKDPWQARDDYISVVLDRSTENVERFLAEHRARELSRPETVKTLRLLEMQRHAMLMYTSCGWFFDEISGLETTQVLQYAARAMQLAEKVGGVQLEADFVKLLATAPSNIAEHASGAEVYTKFVKPAAIDLPRVGAHYAVASLFEEHEAESQVFCYSVTSESYEFAEAGRQKLAVGRARLRSNVTWDERAVSFAVLHLGDHNLIGGVREYRGEEAFADMQREVKEAFLRSDVPGVIRAIDQHFEEHNYTLRHLFKDEQRRVFNRILHATLEEVEASFRSIYDHHYPILQMMREAHMPLPKSLAITAEFTVNANLRRLLESEDPDEMQLENQLAAVRRWKIELDRASLGYAASQNVRRMMERVVTNDPARLDEDVALLRAIEAVVGAARSLNLDLDVWRAQNLHYTLAVEEYARVEAEAEGGDAAARAWLEHYEKVGRLLQIKSV
jgi:alpha-amylase/alpha-mannosidase (GH57 family)